MTPPISWNQYRAAQEPLPADNLTWPFAGQGLAGVGVDGAPVAEPMPTCGPDEILVRMDAVGICSSDAKMVRLGNGYPLFHGRDLGAQPAQLGHEVAMTVVAAGARWAADYRPGLRLGIQPDIFVDGVRSCFGVTLPGGLTRYLTLGPAILAGDHGSYVFPVPAAMSDAAVALLEPWACVEAAYVARRRLAPKAGGTLWIWGRPGDTTKYGVSVPWTSASAVVTDVPPALEDELRAQVGTVATLPSAAARARRYDDIILLDPRDDDVIRAAAAQLAPEGTLTIVSPQARGLRAPLDAGRIHYEFIGVMGCAGPDIAAAWGPARNRSDVRAGGVLLIAGAGGPMGRMHLQRALQMSAGPRTVIVTNRGRARLQSLLDDFAPQAAAQGRRLIGLSPADEPGRLATTVAAATGGRGCDDIVVMAPDLDLMQEALAHLAPDGMLALFAGVPPGNCLHVPVDHITRHGLQVTGTSGSSLADQHAIIAKTAAGELAPDRIVAAVGGLRAAREAIAAVANKRFAGKIVIYPQLVDLPLLSLDAVAARRPAVAAALGADRAWNATAERALLTAELGLRTDPGGVA